MTCLRFSAVTTLLLVLVGFRADAQTPPDPFPIVEGWTIQKDTTLYTPANLWDFIDGAAELYLAYGFVDLHVAEYVKPEIGQIKVEIYRHKSRADAFGIYSQERNPEYRFLEIGAEGYAEEGVLHFFCGTYYVKISTHQKGDAVRSATLTIAREVERRLNQGRTWPEPISLLPQAGKEARSETYIGADFLGHACLHSAYTVRYLKPVPLSLFLIEADSAGQAKAMLQKYLEVLHPKAAPPIEGTMNLSDPNNGLISILLVDRYLCGAYNCDSPTARAQVLAALRENLARVLRK